MIKLEIREAIKKAISIAENDITPQESVKNISVDEVMMSDDGSSWVVTLGWDEKRSHSLGSAISSIYGSFVRVHRTFYFDSTTGDFQKMTMWNDVDDE